MGLGNLGQVTRVSGYLTEDRVDSRVSIRLAPELAANVVLHSNVHLYRPLWRRWTIKNVTPPQVPPTALLVPVRVSALAESGLASTLRVDSSHSPALAL